VTSAINIVSISCCNCDESLTARGSRVILMLFKLIKSLNKFNHNYSLEFKAK
jgi:hypothetical protein